MPKETFPKWLMEEIQHVSFKDGEDWAGSGYILDINKNEKKIDVQFYEKLPASRYIATLEVPEKLSVDSFEQAVVYMFKFKAFESNLSEKARSFLKEHYGIEMQSIYRFELDSAERLESETSSAPTVEVTEDDERGE
jgi:hypothetical protein